MLDLIKTNKLSQAVCIIFGLFLVWWLAIYVRGLTDSTENVIFAAAYWIIPFIGGTAGLIGAKKWGGFSSVMGRAIIALSIGLYFQTLGQLVFAYYNIFQEVEVPYPSMADIGYFGSVIAYIYGAYLLGKVVGVGTVIKSSSGKIQAIVIPVAMILLAFVLFGSNQSIDLTHPLTTFLNFGYPIFEAMYISLAILALSSSRKFLGGVMRSKILWLLAAFVAQFVAEYTFLLFSDSYYNAGVIDLFYMISYLIMTLSLIQLVQAADRIETQS